MKQVLKRRSSTVAWFKLAELISRGEKEKALNLYRLLSHSFDERAYVLQLEGDILWSFEDAQAIERYRQAAVLYHQEQEIASAVGVYEHLLTLNPDDHESVHQLILLYAKLDWPEKFKDRLNVLFDLLDEKGLNADDVWQVLESIVGQTKSHAHLKKLLRNCLKERAPSLLTRVKALCKA